MSFDDTGGVRQTGRDFDNCTAPKVVARNNRGMTGAPSSTLVAGEGAVLCACCSGRSLGEAGSSYEICPMCGWEADGTEAADPDRDSGCNHGSLNDYRRSLLDEMALDDYRRTDRHGVPTYVTVADGRRDDRDALVTWIDGRARAGAELAYLCGRSTGGEIMIVATEVDRRWHPFENGGTLGQTGSEEGTIEIDEEHPLGARITLEADARTPAAVTCGIYGWMVHTRFFGDRAEAADACESMKRDLDLVAGFLASAGEFASDADADGVMGVQPVLSSALRGFLDRYP